MSETIRIAEQLRYAFTGEAWHGPAVYEILADVNAATAASHPIPNAHSIWELTLHVAAWERVALRRMAGHAATLTDEENFPNVTETSEAAWAKAIQVLKNSHAELLTAVSSMPDARLNERVPGKDYDFYYMLHGVVQHALYHAGQMALLKKAIV
jgi:uncharacterized damage-inducible protein DinB